VTFIKRWANHTKQELLLTFWKKDTMSCQTTTLILTKDHEDIILSTLNSAKEFGEVLVADLGSKDNTVAVCKEAGVKVYNTPFNYNYSIIRNNLAAKASTEWLFWLDPGETVTSGQEYFEAEKTDLMYRIMVLKGDLLMKQPRLAHKGNINFTRPVFEDVEKDISEQTLPIIVTGNTRPDSAALMDCILHWKDQDPLSWEPDYYLACLHLMYGRVDQFLSVAEHFLFQKKNLDASTALIRYYMATLIKKKNVGKAVQLTLEAIAVFPLMAEFWCLLGDLYLQIKELDRAYLFYENAVLLGSQRLAEDTMPMEISKYDEYPKKMMEGIKKAIQKTMG
jgi:glycosyltransferase involved in cell wall biosynthesis